MWERIRYNRLFWLLVWWLWFPVVLGVVWLYVTIITPGIGDWRRDFELSIKSTLLPDGLNILNATGMFWIMMVIGLLGTVVILWSFRANTSSYDRWCDSFRKDLRVHILLLAVVVLSACLAWGAFWNDDKDEARYYNQAVVFNTPSLDKNKAPSGVSDLLDGAAAGNGKDCQQVGRHDVPSCINEKVMPDTEWQARTSSLAGAKFFLGKKTGDKSGVNLMEESVTYLYSEDGGGKWTGIRDGSGKRTPMYGVVEWSGKGDPTECYFNRDGYNLNRALNGETLNSLVNLIGEKYRPLLWDKSDIWGYCDDTKPVVVIPMKRVINYNNRTVETAAGVLIMRGSQNGDPDFEFRSNVKAGELPGPVYPISLVSKQRDMLQWAAGRRAKNQSNFGYEATDADAQTGNASEYLLRDSKSGRLYWVSPMTPRGDSELFVAYMLTAADQVNDSSLNRSDVYVLADNDPRRVNLDTLDNTVKQVVGTQDAGFIPSGGKIVEYLPLDKNTWQVYAERGGAPVYVITIPVGAAKANPTIATITQDGLVLQPRTVNMSQEGRQQPDPSDPSDTVGCSKTPAQMSEPELAQCLGQFADEYRRRHPN